MTWPVMYEAAGDARNAIRPAHTRHHCHVRRIRKGCVHSHCHAHGVFKPLLKVLRPQRTSCTTRAPAGGTQRTRHLLHLANAPHGCARQHLCLVRLILQDLLCERSRDVPRRHGVDPYAVTRPLTRQVLRELVQRGCTTRFAMTSSVACGGSVLAACNFMGRSGARHAIRNAESAAIGRMSGHHSVHGGAPLVMA